MSTHKVAILIPIKNGLEYLKTTMQSLMNSTRYPYKIVIIDGGSTDGTKEYCDELVEFWPHIEVHYRNGEGVMSNINYGLEVCKPYDVLMTHNDVIFYNFFPRDWLASMAYLAKEQPDCGIVVSTNGYGISGKDFIDGLVWAGTWCTYLPRRVLDKVGYLDMAYAPGMGDDVDLTYRIRLAGYEMYSLGFEVIHHRFGVKPQDTDEIQIHKNAHYFRNKFKIDVNPPTFDVGKLKSAIFLP